VYLNNVEGMSRNIICSKVRHLGEGLDGQLWNFLIISILKTL